MINGAHAILYSDDADATRAILAKLLDSVGGCRCGWLIFEGDQHQVGAGPGQAPPHPLRPLSGGRPPGHGLRLGHRDVNVPAHACSRISHM